MMRFDLGQIVATPGVLQILMETGVDPLPKLLRRHATGDWGEVDAEDREANNRAVAEGDRLLSAYTVPTGQRIWIITEADRSATTFLLPEEY